MKWRKSSKCEFGSCVEVAIVGALVGPSATEVAVRNSEMPNEKVWFTHDEWQVFVEGVKAGEFDVKN